MSTLSNLLIIEDEPFQLDWLHELCRPLADTIHKVRDGLAALDIIRQQGMPDVLICDLNMPGMDGVSFLRSLAQWEAPCPVLLVSAASADVLHAVVQMAALEGVTVCHSLQKPVSRQQLQEQLGHLPKPLTTPLTEPHAFSPNRQELQLALEAQQFEAYFQPQVEADTGVLTGVEALARWEHPTRGTLSPACFIEPLQRHHLMAELSWQMLGQSIAHCRQWLALGMEIQVSVNVPPSALTKATFADRVIALLEYHGLPGRLLCLEITETEDYGDLPSLLETASRLRLHGVELAIDDFGTGHASLLHLVQSPVSTLKIDRVFVANMQKDARYRSAVHLSLGMASDLDMHTVAEGVETQEQIQMLREMGCHSLQGFYFSPALPARDLVPWWQHRQTMM